MKTVADSGGAFPSTSPGFQSLLPRFIDFHLISMCVFNHLPTPNENHDTNGTEARKDIDDDVKHSPPYNEG
jgi:hypothetical protein